MNQLSSPNVLEENLVNIKCPSSGSEQCKKAGKAKDGRQKYRCHNCNRWHTQNPKRIIIRNEKVGIKCPKCQSKNIKKGSKTQKGKQTYNCKNCRKNFIENP